MPSNDKATQDYNILVDTTFLLPSVGGEINNVSVDFFKWLEGHSLPYSNNKSLRIKLYASSSSLLELLGKTNREILKLDDPVKKTEAIHTLNQGLRALLLSPRYKWKEQSVEILIQASELRRLGHRDMIDNILVATCQLENLWFLTLDTMLKEFLEVNSINTNWFMTPEQLMTLDNK